MMKLNRWIVILMIFIPTGCTTQIPPLETFRSHLSNDNFGQAYAQILDETNKTYLQENKILEYIKDDLVEIKTFDMTSEMDINGFVEVDLIGKVRDVTVFIKFDGKQILELKYDIKKEKNKTVVDENYCLKELLINENYTDVFENEMVAVAFTNSLNLLEGNHNKYDLSVTKIESVVKDDFNKKVYYEDQNRTIQVYFEVIGGKINSYFIPIEPLIEKAQSLQVLNNRLQINLNDFNREMNGVYQTENTKRQTDIIISTSYAFYLGEFYPNELYGHLSDQLINTFTETEFVKYYELMVKRVMPEDKSLNNSGSTSIHTLYEVPFYIGYHHRSYHNDTVMINGFYEMDLNVEPFENSEKSKSIENIYYVKYLVDYQYDPNLVILRGNQKEFLSLLSNNNIDVLYDIEVENQSNLNKEDFIEMFNYQLKIVGDYNGLMIPSGSYLNDLSCTEIKEYINISSEGKMSRIILLLDQKKNVINYNVAFIVGE